MNTQSNFQTIQYRITAQIHKLKINKNISFQTKVIWKRHQNKTQTKVVNHLQGISTFLEPLVLDVGIQYDPVKKIYLEKNTQFLPAVILQTGTKSGGSAKVDVADVLNKNLTKMKKIIPLTKCPDPQGYLQVTFNYEMLQQNEEHSEMSILMNNSQITLNTSIQLSQIQLKDQVHKIGQLSHLHNTINKFEELAIKLKNKGKKKQNESDKNSNLKLQNLEQQNNKLKLNLKKAEQKLQYNEMNWKSEKKQLQKKYLQIEKLLQIKSQELLLKNEQIEKLYKTVDKLSRAKSDFESTFDSRSSVQNKKYEQLYKQLKSKYQYQQEELEMMQSKLKETQSKIKQNYQRKQNSTQLNFFDKTSFDNHDFGKQFGSQISQEKFIELQNQKIQLQTQLALTSHKIGTLFNAAYQIGGAKLLDKLQSSIGLIQLL